MLKIVNLQPIDAITHHKHILARYLCKDEKGVLYHVICLSKRVPKKTIFYKIKHGVPRAIAM